MRITKKSASYAPVRLNCTSDKVFPSYGYINFNQRIQLLSVGETIFSTIFTIENDLITMEILRVNFSVDYE